MACSCHLSRGGKTRQTLHFKSISAGVPLGHAAGQLGVPAWGVWPPAAVDMFLYYEEGNPKAVVAPDVFVVLGAPKHKRFSYQLWREPKGPDFVLELRLEGDDQRFYDPITRQRIVLLKT